jgi:hypothetical protein
MGFFWKSTKNPYFNGFLANHIFKKVFVLKRFVQILGRLFATNQQVKIIFSK